MTWLFCWSFGATMPKLRRAGLFEGLAMLSLTIFEFARRLTQITRRNNVVAIKNTACLVTGDAHGYPLAHASAHHVSNRCSAQVVKN